MNNKENSNNADEKKKPKSLVKLLLASCFKYFSFKKSRLKSYYKSKKRFLKEYSDTKDFKDTKFNDLAPKDDIEKSEEYFNAIEWALHNEEIYNIALTGPYGSGKSSILKSFQKSHIKYNYLNISLAAFDVKSSGAPGGEGGNNYDSNEIEKGILQQLFYKVDSSRIPYTRFRKIINTRFSSIIKIIVPIALNIILGLLIFVPSIIDSMKEKSEELSTYIQWNLIHNSIYIVFTILVFYNIYIIIKHYKSRFKLSKLTFQKAQLEIDKQDTESVFNKYLDEILYFFETTNYNVVMIEDLDRFNNSKIFTKLRELNLLINNYEKIKRRILFIYAVKDDMFKKDERTKFFDFIIPVIPVINQANAGEVLKKLVYQDNLGKDISKEFINGVSVYISDMRMLTNIYNEFRLYKSILNDIDLKSDKILALAIYKNLYPYDFADLQFNKGLVYDAFLGKENFVHRKIEEINDEIDKYNSLIKAINDEHLKSIRELKIVFWQYVLDIDSDVENINGVTRESFFKNDFDCTDIFSMENLQFNKGYWNDYTVNLEQINKRSGSEYSFLERYKTIKNNNESKIYKIKNKIDKLNEDKKIICRLFLSQLISKYGGKEVLSDEVQNEKLIVYLLRHGYIDESYENYLTYFYENTVTARDMNFILSVRNFEALPFNYELTKLEGIMDKLSESEFSQIEILNFDLFKYILENKDKYSKELDNFVSRDFLEAEVWSEFVDEFKTYIESEKCEKDFWQKVCSSWENMWAYIIEETNYSDDKKDIYLLKILKYVDVETVCSLDLDATLSRYISNNKNFTKLANDLDINKLKEVIETLDIKFNVIETKDGNKELINYIWDECRYNFKKEIIFDILQAKSNAALDEIKCKNYTMIKNSNYQQLIDYVVDNIGAYIEKVFLEIDENVKEEKEYIIELLNLNDEELSKELKIKIIDKEEFALSELELVPDVLWKELINNRKVTVNWINVINYYIKAGKLDEVLINFLSEENVYKVLSKEIFDDDENTDLLAKEIIECDRLEGALSYLLKSIPWTYDQYNVSNIPHNNLSILIENNMFTFNKNIYSSIYESAKDLIVRFIELNLDEYIKNIGDYEISVDNIDSLLNLDKCSIEDKNIILKKLNNLLQGGEVIDETLIDKIYEIAVQEEKIKFEYRLFSEVFNSCDLTKKLRLLSSQVKNLQKSEIATCLNNIGGHYSKMTILGSREKIEYSGDVLKLAKSLKKGNYISSYKEENSNGKRYIRFIQFKKDN